MKVVGYGDRLSVEPGAPIRFMVSSEAPRYRAVLKQSLGKLRVEREWLSDRDRIFREAAAMRWAQGRVRGGRVPQVLLEDCEDFVIAMESAPANSAMWKTRLFGGEFDPACARSAERARDLVLL